MKTLVRVTTVSGSLGVLLKGQLNFMSEYYNVVGIAGGKANLDKIAIEEGIAVINLNMTRTITPLKDLIVLLKLFFILRKLKPFIVHSHTPKAGTLAMLAARLAGVPNRLHTIAGLPLIEVSGPKRILLNVVEKITYACATKIYPNSNGLKEIILENNFTSESKIKVLGNGSSNGINTDYFNPKNVSESNKELLKANLGIKEHDFIFLYLGRIVKDKGINELITGFSELTKDNASIKLLLVGPYEDDLDPISAEVASIIHSDENIISLGWQDDVRPYFAICDVLVFPSYREGFPNVVMQAGAMNTPSIVSDINGCNEIVQNGLNGLVIPVKDKHALSSAMHYMINNPAKRKLMAKRSRKLIIDRFDQLMVWNAILKEYQILEGN